MGRKKKKNIQSNIRKEIKEEREATPFDNIVLKEKKTPEKIKPVIGSTKAKRPSEIVQGYNPSISFADILYSYEKTGNPYSMPKPKASKKESNEDFGAILDKWEGRGKSNAQKRVESVKNEYKPTKSFGDILASYERSSGVKESPMPKKIKKENKVSISTLFREEDKDNKIDKNASWSIIGGRNNDFIREEKEQAIEEKKVRKASFPYKPSMDFSDILDAFENKDNARAKMPEDIPEPIIVEEDEITIEREEESIPLDSSERFFRKEDDDNVKASNVAWSIIGGRNEDFIRPEEEKKDFEPQKKNEYKPTKDFSEILESYENEKNPIKTFDEILKEKGEKEKEKPRFSITKLRSMPPQATLDLHGETQQNAEEMVTTFLEESHINGLRKICIITGKGLHSESGEGVIRPLVEKILDKSSLVSEKNNAPLSAGGSGALWIILKA